MNKTFILLLWLFVISSMCYNELQTVSLLYYYAINYYAIRVKGKLPFDPNLLL